MVYGIYILLMEKYSSYMKYISLLFVTAEVTQWVVTWEILEPL